MNAFLAEMQRILQSIKNGNDPIEALHGHICRPDCWHNAKIKIPKPKRARRA